MQNFEGRNPLHAAGRRPSPALAGLAARRPRSPAVSPPGASVDKKGSEEYGVRLPGGAAPAPARPAAVAGVGGGARQVVVEEVVVEEDDEDYYVLLPGARWPA